MLKLTFNLIFAALALVALFSLSPNKVAALNCANPATTADAIKCGSNDVGGQADNAKPSNLNDTIHNIINILSVVIGIVAVVMIMVGGFRYITSGGKQESVSAAKNTILYAIIGLIVVALAQVIARFVLHNVG
jgi:beta-lactamase regulating signal transducer with metallopeptidase domain